MVDALRGLGHDVMSVRTHAPGISDEQVLTLATDEARLLLTADKDFGEAMFRRGEEAAYGILLLRVRGSTQFRTTVVAEALNSREDWSNVFAVVDNVRTRTVELPTD